MRSELASLPKISFKISPGDTTLAGRNSFIWTYDSGFLEWNFDWIRAFRTNTAMCLTTDNYFWINNMTEKQLHPWRIRQFKTISLIPNIITFFDIFFSFHRIKNKKNTTLTVFYSNIHSSGIKNRNKWKIKDNQRLLDNKYLLWPAIPRMSCESNHNRNR